jgi:hypothetical protein
MNDKHFYNEKGELVTEVPCSSKEGMRPLRITDVPKLKLYPSPTTIISDVRSTPYMLTRWGENIIKDKCFEAYYKVANKNNTSQIHKLETKLKFLENVNKEIQKEKDIAPDIGKKVHAACECVFDPNFPKKDKERIKDTNVLVDLRPVRLGVFVDAVERYLKKNKLNSLCSEQTFSNRHFRFTGTIDSLCVDLDFWLNLIDVKTAKTKPGEKVFEKESYLLQLAAYSKLIDIKRDTYNQYIDIFSSTSQKSRFFGAKGIRGAKILVLSKTEPGRLDAIEYSKEELDSAFDAFMGMYEAWKFIYKKPLKGWLS